ncbi:hypothetical protein FRX31_028076 [Thalictrum thalictroides]|uniref:Uncharacterized protein n=1 Tax=Thalictrum thalictroides TaxID=46969 RepID=A0A7J6VDB3_THATH|nr:hypothetical protein FRX31_028076 [Thalictrum thalictroides]
MVEPNILTRSSKWTGRQLSNKSSATSGLISSVNAITYVPFDGEQLYDMEEPTCFYLCHHTIK